MPLTGYAWTIRNNTVEAYDTELMAPITLQNPEPRGGTPLHPVHVYDKEAIEPTFQ